MADGRGGSFTPNLCSLAALRERTGQGCKCSTGRALGVVRHLCRGRGMLACPEASSECVKGSVIPAVGRQLETYTAKPCEGPTNTLVGRPIHTGKDFISSGGIDSRRTVVPARRFIRLSRVAGRRHGVCSVMIHEFLDILCPPFICRRIDVRKVITKRLFTTDKGIMGDTK